MTDSHGHLDQPAFNLDRRAVLERARRAGVSTIVSIGMLDEEASWKQTFSLVDGVHPNGEDHADPDLPQLFTTLGCHPHDARLFGELGGEERLAELAGRPRLLAIGEVGLDYHYDLSPRAEQRDVFRRQIRVARELGLPVVVHHRDAEDDFLQIADEEELAECGAILHCFTASERLAPRRLGTRFPDFFFRNPHLQERRRSPADGCPGATGAAPCRNRLSLPGPRAAPRAARRTRNGRGDRPLSRRGALCRARGN